MGIAQSNLTMSPGDKLEATVSLRNLGQTVDQFSLGVQGLDESWYDLPVSSVALFPNDQDQLKINIQLPEKMDRKIPSYSFTIVAASQENPEDKVTATVSIQIEMAPEAQIFISPQTMSAREGSYQVQVVNPSASDVKVRLKPQDSRNKLKYTLQPEVLTVPANNQAEATLTAKMKLWPYIFTGSKPFDFDVTASSADDASAESLGKITGNLVNVPWWRPITQFRIPWLSRPPKIVSFDAKTEDKREYKISWVTKKGAKIQLDGADVDPTGETILKLTEDKTFELVVTNKHGKAAKTIEVKPLPLPQPRSLPRLKVSLSETDIKVQAGPMPYQLFVSLQNLGEIVDKFTVEVEGLDQSWYSRSASSVALMPKAADQVQISFKPPKVKGVKAGVYPFGITVRSQSTENEYATVVGQLEILPSVEYKIKVQPYRITTSGKGKFRVNITNTDVSPASIKLSAVDLEENCKIKFENDAPVVGAWNTIEIPMVVKPKKGRAVGESRRFDITVTATAPQSMEQTSNCEYTHKPRMSSWKWLVRLIKLFIVLAVFIVAIYFILKIGGGWQAFIDNPRFWVTTAINNIEAFFSSF